MCQLLDNGNIIGYHSGMSKKLKFIETKDVNETGAEYYFEVSKKTAALFGDPGQWVFGYDNIITVGCLPENLDNVLYDEFNRVGLDISEFECERT